MLLVPCLLLVATGAALATPSQTASLEEDGKQVESKATEATTATSKASTAAKTSIPAPRVCPSETESARVNTLEDVFAGDAEELLKALEADAAKPSAPVKKADDKSDGGS